MRSASFVGAAGLLLSSCGYGFEQRRVEQQFATAHRCDPVAGRSVEGTWIARGCGVTAHYVCDHARVSRGGLLPQVFAGEIGCREVRSFSGTPHPRSVARVRATQHEDGFPVLTASFPAERARIRMLGAPTREPELIYLEITLASDVADDATPDVRIWVDGDVLPVTSVRMETIDGRRVRLVKFPVAWLARMARATRVTGIASAEGWRFPTGASAILLELDARFREMQTAGDDAGALVGL